MTADEKSTSNSALPPPICPALVTDERDGEPLTNDTASSYYEGDTYNKIEGNNNIIGGHRNTNVIHNHNYANQEEDEFITLRRHAESSAHHGELADRSMCDPRIQEVLITYVERWVTSVNDQPRKYPILWLRGPFGLDQATLQKMSQALGSERSFVSAFFFSSSATDPKDFVATISYQLSVALPSTKQYIKDAIRKDKLIFKLSFQEQARLLVISPLCQACIEPSFVSSRWIILVGGFDHCQTFSKRIEILEVLRSMSQKLPIPFAVIVTGRPQNDIRMQKGLEKSILQVDLDDFKLHIKARRTIEREFKVICETHPMNSRLPQQWPPDGLTDELLAWASGQMIYLQTVIRFLQSNRHNPADRLDALIELGALRGELLTATENLDTLYSALLYAVNLAGLVSSWRLLGVLLVPYRDTGLKDPNEELSVIQFKAIRVPAYLEELFGWKAEYVRHTLDVLDFLLNIGGNYEDICIYDSSLRDYFFDKTRSKEFFIDEGNIYADLAERCISILSAQKAENWKKFLLFFMWNSELFFSKAASTDGLRRAIDHCKITKINPTRSYPDSINDLWPTFLGAIQKAASIELRGLYPTKLLEYEKIFRTKMQVYFDYVSLKYFIITVALTWINTDDLAKNIFQISSEEIEMEREHGFNILNSRNPPGVILYIRKLLNDDGWGDYFVDEDEYADVALYLLKNIFRRQRAISVVSWFKYQSLPCSDNTMAQVFPPLLSKCSSLHHNLSQFVKSKASMLRNSSSAPFRDAIEDYIERSNFGAANPQVGIWRQMAPTPT